MRINKIQQTTFKFPKRKPKQVQMTFKFRRVKNESVSKLPTVKGLQTIV